MKRGIQMAEYEDTYPNEEFMFHLMYLKRGSDRLKKLGKPMRVSKGEKLNRIDEIPGCCYVVESGRVICYEYSFAGDRRVYNIMEPSSILMEGFMLFDCPCPVQFEALDDCELIWIDKCDLKRAFKHDIDVVMDVCESLSGKFMSAMEQLRLGPHSSAEWRICKMLRICIDHYGEKQPDGSYLFNKRISQQMLADILAMNRVTVVRKLKELKELGLVDTVNGRFYVRDVVALEKHMITMENGNFDND